MNDRLYTTRLGLVRLQQRLNRARADYRAACAENPEAREAGDSSVWHDNFAFEDLQRRMHQLARTVRDLEGVLASSEVVEPPDAPTSAGLATLVHLAVHGEVRERVVAIAGHEDGDPRCGRVSYTSPFARALMGAAPGDEVRLPDGRTAVVASVAPWIELPGRLIVLEGLDGTGKSTAALGLARALGAELVVTPPEPIRAHRSAIEEGLRGQPNAVTTFYLEGDLLASDLARQQLAAGRDVIFDRYIVSTVVNARERGDAVDTSRLEGQLLRPDLTLIIELEEGERLRRLRHRGMTAHDATTIGDRAARLAAVYREEAQRRDPERVRVVDLSGLDEREAVERLRAVVAEAAPQVVGPVC